MKIPEHWTAEDLATFRERVAINSDGSRVPFNELPISFVTRAIAETEEARKLRERKGE
jgi:hypothetical protein